MDLSTLGVQIAKRLSPEMYAAATQRGLEAITNYAKTMAMDAVIESLVQELYETGVTEERIHEVIERGGARASMMGDLFLMQLSEQSGGLDDSLLPHD